MMSALSRDRSRFAVSYDYKNGSTNAGIAFVSMRQLYRIWRGKNTADMRDLRILFSHRYRAGVVLGEGFSATRKAGSAKKWRYE